MKMMKMLMMMERNSGLFEASTIYFFTLTQAFKITCQVLNSRLDSRMEDRNLKLCKFQAPKMKLEAQHCIKEPLECWVGGLPCPRWHLEIFQGLSYLLSEVWEPGKALHKG